MPSTPEFLVVSDIKDPENFGLTNVGSTEFC